ncbi:hypothetical protein B0H34DRAFT_336591 [Crassisporium funariophilum]|nr:hypothetical protein B0H34DRAFT_336591 [Crassisporium funariophilum]
MPIANGFISSTAAWSFIATFDVEGYCYVATGNYVPSSMQFNNAPATLTYRNFNQLTSRRSIQGTVGIKTIILNAANGPVIAATLTAPVDPAESIDGSIEWSIKE